MGEETASKSVVKKPHVVIVGGGFGGIECARYLAGLHADVTIIDRNNHMVFQPLLYQVATGVLAENAIASPLRRIFEKQSNVKVLMADVKKVNLTEKSLTFKNGSIRWDYLVLAAGMENDYFGNEQWRKYAWGLKTIAEASDIRAKILSAFENAERALALQQLKDVESWLTFVVVGGGPTGVELAGAIKQLAVNRISGEFKRIDVSKTRVLLVDCKSRLLSSMSMKSSNSAARKLEKYGVEVLLNTSVNEINKTSIRLNNTTVRTHTVIWAAGVKGSPLASQIASQLGIELPRIGKIPVNADLTIANRHDIRVIGDLAQLKNYRTNQFIPGVAQAALQMGRYAGRSIHHSLRNPTDSSNLKPFEYQDKGTMATVGKGYAVLDAYGFHLSGIIAWALWAVVHITFLINFRSRLAALWSWSLAYIFNNGINELIIQNDDHTNE